MAKSRKGQSCIEASRHQLLSSLSCSCWVIEAENEMDALLLAEPLVLQAACPLWPVGIFQSHLTVLTARMHFQKSPDCRIGRSLYTSMSRAGEGGPCFRGSGALIKIPVGSAFKSRFTRRAFSAPFPHHDPSCDPSQHLNTSPELQGFRTPSTAHHPPPQRPANPQSLFFSVKISWRYRGHHGSPIRLFESAVRPDLRRRRGLEHCRPGPPGEFYSGVPPRQQLHLPVSRSDYPRYTPWLTSSDSDQLRENALLKKYYCDINIDDLNRYNEEIAHRLLNEPADIIPLVIPAPKIPSYAEI